VDRLAQLIAFAPRHRNHVVARSRYSSRDRKANAAASTGYQNIMHRSAPTFPRP